MTSAVFFCAMFNAQIAIGKDNITNQSTLLEFGTEAKGIILPSVDSAPGAVGGTFIVNINKKAVEYHNGTDWVSMTNPGEAINYPYIPQQVPDNVTNQNVIIGSSTSTKPGVLVLESSTKAMILPKVTTPHTSIKSPIAGTMAYDIQSDSLAICDGQNWFFWQ